MEFKKGFLSGMGFLLAISMLIVAVGAVIASNGTSPNAIGTAIMNGSGERTISVTGNEAVYVTPDIATVSVGVTTQADNAADAMSANAASMSKVVDALKAMGIDDKDIQTGSVSLTPQYGYAPETTLVYNHAAATPDSSGTMSPMIPAKSNASTASASPLLGTTGTSSIAYPSYTNGQIVGYTAQDTVQVTVRDTSKAGAVIDAASDCGANDIYGVYFQLSDDTYKQAYADALQKAVSDGKSKADVLASAAGIGNIGLKIMTEGYSQGIVYNSLNDIAPAAASASTPVEAGQQEVSASVSMVYTF